LCLELGAIGIQVRRIVASDLCQTDLAEQRGHFLEVLDHEGAGIAE
jgi:hypothetical protein